jgi:phosphoglycerate dehydrogenase-like enzyme
VGRGGVPLLGALWLAGGMDRPLVLLDPAPQRRETIFAAATWRALHERFRVVEVDSSTPEGAATFDLLLPEAFAVVGQPDLTTERLQRATALRAVCNVEGNFLPNVDYPTCHDRGVYLLNCGPAYAQAVAEYSLGLALDLARGITREDRAFREGRERYTSGANQDAVLLRHADVGLVGFGNLGRALLPLLRPFAPRIRVYDPWLPDSALREADVEPAGLEQVLSESTFVFVLATVTDESEHLLDGKRLDLLRPAARLVLVSRAAVVDFPALYERVATGRFLAAVDVWPAEPVAPDDPVRRLEGMLLSAHRAGGIEAAFHTIGEMVVDDLSQVAAGLPPVRMQVAARELVQRYRNRPVS